MATRPDNLGSSSKRAHFLALYSSLLPSLEPSPATVLSTALSLFRSPLAPAQIEAKYDCLTKTVSVHGELDMVQLWRRGFFGKGSLSRSEPSWRRRVDNRRAIAEGRETRLTAEEVTAQRRLERKGTKMAKKLEREAEKLVAASAAASERASSAGGSPRMRPSNSGLPSSPADEDEDEEDELVAVLEKIVEERDADAGEEGEEEEVVPDEPPPLWHLDAEYTQLQPEEAFFLLFGLGVLSLRPTSPFDDPASTALSQPLSILDAWRNFLTDEAVLALPLPSILDNPTLNHPALERLDSPFLINYAVYHHYRSMGWVARSGVKFCVDWVLYGQGGPVGGHAEFAVVVVPNYADPADALTSPFRSTLASAGFGAEELAEGEAKNSWKYFSTINRVCSGVKKTLVLLQVLIPPLSSLPEDKEWIAKNPAQAIARFEMREVTVRRWLAGRMRD
ncbi:hypothetical protein RQP46_003519 [Phenoliferia psychrophenolica]